MTVSREPFLLDPEVTFLNHGSFGACPKSVFDRYQAWQREAERQPVEFWGRRYDGLMNEARAGLGAYLNVSPDDLVFVPNATAGINMAARSLKLHPGDEILTTDHEYGAMDYTWQFVCHRTGAHYRRHVVPIPVTTPQAFVESFWAEVTPRTRIIFISHITSPTALIFPIAEICRRARAAGIMTVIDGAHAPGQIPLDLTALDADIYTGNLHKWLCAPKGAAFLYVRRDLHTQINPLIISWGELPDAPFSLRNQWQGTRDFAAFLTVAEAIAFQKENNWDVVRERCHGLASLTRQRFAERYGLEPICPDSPEWFGQMITVPLPPCDVLAVKTRLYDEYKVEVPNILWNERPFVRVSFQGYNTEADLDRLMEGLDHILG